MLSKLISYEQAKNQLTHKQKVGQLFMHAVFINDTEENIVKTEIIIKKLHIGSICFFHSRESAAANFEGKKEIIHNENSHSRLKQLINRYQKVASIPLLVAIDAEWGLAMRVENTNCYPYALTLGALVENNNLITEVGKQIALDCADAGIHWNLAPVVDVNTNPKNPVIGYRAFGDHKHDVYKKAKAYIKGMNSIGTLNAIKHFPGHGDTDIDSHLGLPTINKSKKELYEKELYPFKELFKSGVDAVMVGHLSIPALDDSGNPSTTSSKIITDLLRKELGYNGVIVSDALNMHAVSKKFSEKGMLEAKAFEAGIDMMCFSEHITEGIDNILSTKQTEKIEQSFERIYKLKEKAFGFNIKKNVTNRSISQLKTEIAIKSITELYSDSDTFKSFNETDFMNISLENKSKNHFSTEIELNYGKQHHILNSDTMAHVKAQISNHDNLLIALYPSSAKPKNHYGINKTLLETLNYLISEKNVLLYLFGNPYLLFELELKLTTNIVVVYQDFKEFQEQAINHFDGKLEAQGELPFSYKPLIHE